LLDDQKWISDELPSLTYWSRIYASFKTNVPGCDDGIFGEGYTEAVAKMLSEKWQLLAELKVLADKDPRFRLFVLKHIDASADPDDLKRIYINATQSCEKENSELCTAFDDDRSKNAFGLMMSLNMLIETPGGFDYTGRDCSGWMKEAGFSTTRVEHLVGPDSMVIAIK
jgi:hypothetical protein